MKIKIQNFQILLSEVTFLITLPPYADSGHKRDHMKEHGVKAMEEGHMHRGKSMMQAQVSSEGGTVKHVGVPK